MNLSLISLSDTVLITLPSTQIGKNKNNNNSNKDDNNNNRLGINFNPVKYETARMWKIKKVGVTPVVIGALRMVWRMDGKARARPESGEVAETIFTWNAKNAAKVLEKRKPKSLQLRSLSKCITLNHRQIKEILLNSTHQ